MVVASPHGEISYKPRFRTSAPRFRTSRPLGSNLDACRLPQRRQRYRSRLHFEFQ